MDKLPSFQFYPGDWKKDAGVQALDYSERGVWFEILIIMHESERRGVLLLNGKKMPSEALAKCLGLDLILVNQILTKLLDYGVASVEAGTGAIYCRRMVREENLRKIRQECGKLGGNPILVKQKPTIGLTTGDNQIPTPSSSSSPSGSERESVSVPPMSREEYDREFSTRPWSKEFLEYWWNELDGVCHWKPKNCEFPLDRKGVGSWLANRWPGWQSVKAKGNGSPPKESAAQREARIATQEREADEQKRKEIAEAKALGAQPMGNFLNKFKEEEAKREKRMQNPNYHPDA